VVFRALLMMVGVVAILIGSQLPWGEFDFGGVRVPLIFFLDLASIGTIIAALAAALGLLGISESLSQRSAGVLLVVLGMAIAGGAMAALALIDQGELDVDPGLAGQIPVSEIELGPGGFVVLAGGITLMLAGLTFIATPLPAGPPLPPGGGTGEVKPGWYSDPRRRGRVGYWTGSKWTHHRRSH